MSSVSIVSLSPLSLLFELITIDQHSNDSKETSLFPNLGSHKVKYNPHSEWDFHLDTTSESIDLSLVLPHYRARNQPVHHRLNLFVGQDAGSLKLKVVRLCCAAPYKGF